MNFFGAMAKITLDEQLRKMRADWDARAKENARYYVATLKEDWTDDEFFASGEQTVAEEILTDMTNICQGLDPADARHRDRQRRRAGDAGAFANSSAKFTEWMSAVRWSPRRHRPCKRAECVRLPEQRHGFVRSTAGPYDFAFSTIVFQHIPSRDVIYNYVREVHRLLRPGALFKFQVQGRCHHADYAGRHVARRTVLRRGRRQDGGGMRLRAALPARRGRAVFLALVLQALVGT
jgi:hypothetical protein